MSVGFIDELDTYLYDLDEILWSKMHQNERKEASLPVLVQSASETCLE